MPISAPRSSRIVVRPAIEADMAQITKIYSHEVLYELGTFEEEVPDIEEMLRRRNSVLAIGLPYLIAEADGQVLGYTYATAYRARPAYRYTVENSVYVARHAHRRGIGRLLLAELIRECEAGPWRQMIAVIGDCENANSIGLHRAMGFRDAGTLKAVGFKFGRWVDTVLMQRPIGEVEAVGARGGQELRGNERD